MEESTVQGQNQDATILGLIVTGQNQKGLSDAKELFDAAAELLVRGYQNYIYRLCVSRVYDETWADDISQEVFITARLAMPKFRHQSQVKTWLHGICEHKIMQAQRNRTRRFRLLASHQRIVADAMYPPERTESVTALMDLLREWGIDKLSKTDQQLFWRRYVAAETIDELVAHSWTSKGAMRQRLAKLLQRIQRNLHDGP